MYSDYWNYFKNLCVQHPSLLHAEEASERVFTRATITEVFTGFKMSLKEKSYGFILIDPTSGVDEPGGSHIFQEYQGGFIIAHYYKRDDNKSFVEAIDKTEAVAKDFIERIIHDSEAGFPLFQFSADRPRGFRGQITTSADGSYAGWMYTFSFKKDAGIRDIECNTRVGWLDDGLTKIN